MATSDISRELARDVLKCGYLKYIDGVCKGNKTITYSTKFWVVFCSYLDEPLLQLFRDKPKSPTRPSLIFSLKKCLHVAPTIVIHDSKDNFEFNITLEDKFLRFAAQTRQLMDEWIDALRNKLRQINILGPTDNYYTKAPNFNKLLSLTSSRPLPPIPGNHSLNSQSSPVLPYNPYTSAYTIHSQSENSNTQSSEIIRASTDTIISNLELLDVNSSTYETIFQEPSDRSGQLPVGEGPPPYENFGQRNCNDQKVLSLRESQILRLQKEINHQDGVRIMIRRKDCNESIALIDWIGKVWVAGWKQKMYPQLHNTFHIGDCIISVCGERVVDSSRVYKLMKESTLIEMVIRRLPHGFVLLLQREEGQDLGLVRESTAEVIQVLEDGLAHRNGLPFKAICADQSKGRECNWVITEINNRPLNLFFKANEIRDRLNAVGKEISLLFQPLDLVKVLKKRLKLFKNYKDYIVQ